MLHYYIRKQVRLQTNVSSFEQVSPTKAWASPKIILRARHNSQNNCSTMWAMYCIVLDQNKAIQPSCIKNNNSTPIITRFINFSTLASQPIHPKLYLGSADQLMKSDASGTADAKVEDVIERYEQLTWTLPPKHVEDLLANVILQGMSLNGPFLFDMRVFSVIFSCYFEHCDSEIKLLSWYSKLSRF